MSRSSRRVSSHNCSAIKPQHRRHPPRKLKLRYHLQLHHLQRYTHACSIYQSSKNYWKIIILVILVNSVNKTDGLIGPTSFIIYLYKKIILKIQQQKKLNKGQKKGMILVWIIKFIVLFCRRWLCIDWLRILRCWYTESHLWTRWPWN